MRHLGPIHFRNLGRTPEEQQYARLYEQQARTMVGQMLSFSGEVAVNGFNRRFPDGTRINVAMHRGGVVPLFVATILPPPMDQLRRREEIEELKRAARPYFFAGLEYVSGGECLGVKRDLIFKEVSEYPNVFEGNEVEVTDLMTARLQELIDLLRPRAVAHLVVWEPKNGDKPHAEPVCVKRWTLPRDKLVRDWFNGATVEDIDTFLFHRFDPGVFFFNPVQNAYWWFDDARDRWRYSFFARNDNNLFVWEYDNAGKESNTPDPRTGEKYLAIAVADPQPQFVQGRSKDFDDLVFNVAPVQERYAPFYLTDDGLNRLAVEARWLPRESLETDDEPPLPKQPATLVEGSYLIKVVIEADEALHMAPITVRLRVQTGLDSAGRPIHDDTYTLTIDGYSTLRRNLYPGGFHATRYFNTPSLDRRSGSNPLSPAWSQETIAADPMGGSGLVTDVPWGFDPAPYEPIAPPYYSNVPGYESGYYGYRNWMQTWAPRGTDPYGVNFFEP